MSRSPPRAAKQAQCDFNRLSKVTQRVGELIHGDNGHRSACEFDQLGRVFPAIQKAAKGILLVKAVTASHVKQPVNDGGFPCPVYRVVIWIA